MFLVFIPSNAFGFGTLDHFRVQILDPVSGNPIETIPTFPTGSGTADYRITAQDAANLTITNFNNIVNMSSFLGDVTPTTCDFGSPINMNTGVCDRNGNYGINMEFTTEGFNNVTISYINITRTSQTFFVSAYGTPAIGETNFIQGNFSGFVSHNVGENITLAGLGFYPNSTSFTVTFNGSPLTVFPPITSVQPNGRFFGHYFFVPNLPVGLYNITVDGGTMPQINNNTQTFDIAHQISVDKFILNGTLTGKTVTFNFPKIKLLNPTTAHLNQLFLYDEIGLIDSWTFPSNITINNSNYTDLPHNFNVTGTGQKNYTVQTILYSGSDSIMASSNKVIINYGQLVLGRFDLNATNPMSFPIYFHRADISTTNVRLDVLYPNAMNLTCNLSYQFAGTNQSYSNLSSVPLDPDTKNSSFSFINGSSDIITVLCTDVNSGQNGKYLLTLNNIPFVQQIKQFQTGGFPGLGGQFGFLDLSTLIVVIFSMIGFNRVNEAVGAVFSAAIIGAAAFFGIIHYPTIMFAAMAIIVILAVASTRKQQGF